MPASQPQTDTIAMKPDINPRKIVGISAESGLPTFRDGDGLWRHHSMLELASIYGWDGNPPGPVLPLD